MCVCVREREREGGGERKDSLVFPFSPVHTEYLGTSQLQIQCLERRSLYIVGALGW